MINKELQGIVKIIESLRLYGDDNYDRKLSHECVVEIAKELVKHYQFRLPKNSIVLSSEEYENLLRQNNGLKEENRVLRLENNDLEAQVERKCKKMGVKIIKYLDKRLGTGELSGNVLRSCAKQFNIDIKD